MIRGRGDTSCQTEIQRPWQHHQFNPAPAHVSPLGWCPPDSCRTSHWGLGVKVDLIPAWHWTVHRVADCQMTFHTHLSTGIKMFRNLNFTAVPPIVSGREDRGETPLPFCADCAGRSVRCGVIRKFIWSLVPVSGHIENMTLTTARLIMACCHQEWGLRVARQDNVWCLGTCRSTCRTKWENQKFQTHQTFTKRPRHQISNLWWCTCCTSS